MIEIKGKIEILVIDWCGIHVKGKIEILVIDWCGIHVEGVNNRIKQIKRRAYGFHDDQYFYLKVKAAFPGLPR